MTPTLTPNPAGRPAVETDGVSGTALPTFSPGRMLREIQRDRLIRVALALAVGLAVLLLAGWLPGRAGVTAGWGLFVSALLVLAVWVTLSVGNAKAAGAARGLLVMVEHQPDQVEQVLPGLLERKALVGWVRVMLYHTWAALRHRQGRHAEAVSLCRSVLSQPLGPGEGARPSVLLLLAESALESGEMVSAYEALFATHAMPLTLGQVLQRLGLQTRYEVSTGADDAACQHLTAKAELAELMPGNLCGATHAMLAVSASRRGDAQRAAWLDARARLLCEPEQLEQLREQGLALPA